MNIVIKSARNMLIKVWISIYEREYSYKGHIIKHLCVDNNSDKLCIVFSGFPEYGKYAAYNYVRTLKKNESFNYLFILDDMVNIPTGGSYYLGSKGDYWALDGVQELIKSYIDLMGAKTVVTAGSSKGGTSALLFGGLLSADYIIAGACQYKIGTYMTHPYHINSLRELTGMYNVSENAIEFLDQIVYKSLEKHQNVGGAHVFLHFSDKEETYNDHICYLIDDLKKLKFSITYDKEDYANHGDVGLYFPRCLLKILDLICNSA